MGESPRKQASSGRATRRDARWVLDCRHRLPFASVESR
jgi:hypothetical protein